MRREYPRQGAESVKLLHTVHIFRGFWLGARLLSARAKEGNVVIKQGLLALCIRYTQTCLSGIAPINLAGVQLTS